MLQMLIKFKRNNCNHDCSFCMSIFEAAFLSIRVSVPDYTLSGFDACDGPLGFLGDALVSISMPLSSLSKSAPGVGAFLSSCIIIPYVEFER